LKSQRNPQIIQRLSTKGKWDMHGFRIASIALAAVALTVALATGAEARQAPRTAGPMTGLVPPRGQARPARSPDLLYHGGPVMATGAAVTAIYWGSTWGSDPQNKRGLLQTFYGGMSSSRYAGTNSEYTQTGGAHVSTSISVSAPLTDLSAAPPRAPKTSAILAEVAKMIPNPVPNGYYPVYTDTPRGHTAIAPGTARGRSTA